MLLHTNLFHLDHLCLQPPCDQHEPRCPPGKVGSSRDEVESPNKKREVRMWGVNLGVKSVERGGEGGEGGANGVQMGREGERCGQMAQE